MKSVSFPLIIPIRLLLISSPIILLFPILKEDIKEINYCYAFEKIIARNIFHKNNYPEWIKNTSKSLINLYVKNSKGNTLREIYQQSDPNTPPDLYCLIGYYGEHFDPGSTSKSFLKDSKKSFQNGFEDFIQGFIN